MNFRAQPVAVLNSDLERQITENKIENVQQLT